VAVLPVGTELDLRSLGKRAAMTRPADAERVTGYVVGGISPVGQRRPLPTLVDESALSWATIYVSAGRRGLEVEIAPTDLIAVTGAKTRRLTRAGE
jgi:Cys-tRNA(Pro)/Cys-tRNA(Cys) deacylase